MKYLKLGLMIVAPVAVLCVFAGCASTPKCDNDACYNRQISSINNNEATVDTNNEDPSDKPVYFRAEGAHRD